jgi:hypothetical protein
MIITIEKCLNCNVKHEWDFDGPHLKELRTIKKFTGLRGEAFGEALVESDPDAITALLYVLHLRDKIRVPFDDIDLDPEDFDMKETEEEKAEREKLEADAKKAEAESEAEFVTPNGMNDAED